MNNDDFTELMNEDPDPQELPAAGNFDEDMMNRGSVKRLQIARALQEQ